MSLMWMPAQTTVPPGSTARRAAGPRSPGGGVGTGVCARGEAEGAEPRRVAGHHERAVADQPGAQKRRRLQVGVALRDREAVARVGYRVLGEAPVEVGAREA